ncbi:MAG: SsrA-binding protein SmpB [Flavobacteriia bacterium]|nr:SsrA-binding protein SmpB [Flavobacteriia bacterium]
MKSVEIKNKRAKFDYEWLDTYTAGLQLVGTEVKSIRMGKASIAEAYCYMTSGELFIKGMNVTEWSHGNIFNHDPIRERKLLLSKRELDKIDKALKDQGTTVIPTKLFISEKGWIKLNIAVAKGKKNYDKRQSLKEKDAKRDLARLKSY